MNLEELQASWIEDSKIDFTKVDLEALNIPRLHSKYLNELSSIRLLYRKLNEKKKKLESDIYEHYDTGLTTEKLGRKPSQRGPFTKNQIEKLVESDDEIIKINIRLAELDETALFLKEVISSINQRTWIIRNFIEWNKFSGGQL